MKQRKDLKMAKYNRELLVPYLQSICALHLAQKKITDHNRQIQNNLKFEQNRLKDGGVKYPEYPNINGEIGCGTIASLIFGTIAIICSLIGFTIPEAVGISFFTLFFGGLPFTVIPLLVIISDKRANDELMNQYQIKIEETKKQRSKNIDDASFYIPIYEKALQDGENEYHKLQELSQKLYSANIIPSQYRNVYAAVYLYDWFSTSGADDLDHALSMFVLEEIKDRLDQIITYQSDMLLNQQIIIANQHKTLESLEKYSSDMKDILNSLETTTEENNKYLSMIEGNTAAIAYFSAAEYYN